MKTVLFVILSIIALSINCLAADMGDWEELREYKDTHLNEQRLVRKNMFMIEKAVKFLIQNADYEGAPLSQATKDYYKDKYLPIYQSLPAGDFKTKIQQIWSEL